jgi:hypothetical protein
VQALKLELKHQQKKPKTSDVVERLELRYKQKQYRLHMVLYSLLIFLATVKTRTY